MNKGHRIITVAALLFLVAAYYIKKTVADVDERQSVDLASALFASIANLCRDGKADAKISISTKRWKEGVTFSNIEIEVGSKVSSKTVQIDIVDGKEVHPAVQVSETLWRQAVKKP